MNKATYKKEDITAYLLGALPEAKTEYFDELSFTDDRFADELKTAEKDLVDAYVNNELKGVNLEKFNSYYLASPLRREKVEFAKSFQTLAGKEMARAAPVVVTEEKPKSFWVNFLTIPQWGFALAALALMFFGGWLLWENSRLSTEIGKIESNSNLSAQSEVKEPEKQLQDEPANQQNIYSEPEKEKPKVREEVAKPERELKKTPQKPSPKPIEKQPTPKAKDVPSPNRQPEEKILAQEKKTPKPGGTGIGHASPAKIFSFVLLPPLRSSNKLPTFTIPSDIYQVNVELRLESADDELYTVVLRNQADNQIVWSGIREAKTKGKNKILSLQILAEKLKPQIYSFEVSTHAPFGTPEIIGNYSFKIVR